MDSKFFVAKEGWVFIVIPALLALGLYVAGYVIMAGICFVLALFCIFFFRNPPRKSASDHGLVFSPADGRVMEVKRVFEKNYLQSDCYQVRIFLSIFNVHINRFPISGRVEWVEKTGGSYLAAYKKEAGTVNVRNYIGINSDFGPLLTVQVTGAIARRIVCWVKPGDFLAGGQRFGLIRFGSCTELYLPLTARIEVEAGDKVKGGESIIARFNG